MKTTTTASMINLAIMRPSLVYSLGNIKVSAEIKNTIIINMGAATDCPSAKKGLCTMGRKCYALKAETQYPDALASRRRAANYWLNTTAENIAADILEAIGSHRINEVRFNESGDFYGQECVTKLCKVADILDGHGVHVYTYTHRKDLDFINLSDNLTLNGTNFMINNEFRPVKKLSYTTQYCPGKCGPCTLCKVSMRNIIEIEIH